VGSGGGVAERLTRLSVGQGRKEKKRSYARRGLPEELQNLPEFLTSTFPSREKGQSKRPLATFASVDVAS